MSEPEPPRDPVVADVAAGPDADADADADAAAAHLRVDGLSGAGLSRRSARGGAMMIGSYAVQLIVGVAGTALLARILRPEDFGYLAMVATLTNFVATFRDLGLPTAAVHRQDLTHAQASGLFWINAAASVAVAAMVAAAAPLLAWFYGEPRLVPVTLVMSAGVLVSSLGNIHAGILRRRMRFGAVTFVEIGAVLFGVIVGVGAALLDAGYWALVYQQVAVYVWQTGAAWLLCRWRPARGSASLLLGDDAGLRSMLRYGTHVSVARVANYVGRNVDAVVVGRLAGAGVLGLYQRAYQWSMMPFWQIYTPLLAVSVSTLSRLQHDPDRYRLYVRTALLGLFALTLPATALMFVEADSVVLLLLGRQWVEAIPMMRVLLVGSYVGSFVNVTNWLYLAEGRTAEQMRWSLIAAPLLVVGVAAGAPRGAIGVAYGLTIATALLVIPGVLHALVRSPLCAGDFIAASWRPVVASLAAAVVSWWLRGLLPGGLRAVVQFGLVSAIFGAAYAGVWLLLPGGLSEASRALAQLRASRGAGGAAAA